MDASPLENPFDTSNASGDLPYHNFGVDNGDEYPACDRNILENGELVVVSAMDKSGTQRVVKRLQNEGHKVDWHWHSSRMVIKALPGQDIVSMRQAITAATDKFHHDLDNNIQRLTETHKRATRPQHD